MKVSMNIHDSICFPYLNLFFFYIGIKRNTHYSCFILFIFEPESKITIQI